MAVLNIKPHSISYESVTGGHNDDNGDYQKGTSYWIENYIKCDAVPSGPEDTFTFEDGTIGKYSNVLYTSSKCREFKKDDKIKVTFSDGTSQTFLVLGFHRYQHQSKIWV